jgi:hypothetical protein
VTHPPAVTHLHHKWLISSNTLLQSFVILQLHQQSPSLHVGLGHAQLLDQFVPVAIDPLLLALTRAKNPERS